MSQQRSTRSRATAFARVPRGNQPVNPGLNVQRIDANFLKRMKSARASDDLNTVMTQLNASLHLTVSPQGGMNAVMKTSDGMVVGDENDIQKIQTLGTAITKERKEALKDDALQSNRHTLASMVQVGDRINRPIIKFPSNFLDVFRPVNSQMQTLAKNANAFQELAVVERSAQHLAKTYILDQSKRIRASVGEFLFMRATINEGETPEKLNHFMRVNGVANYMFSRLTGSVFNTGQNEFDIRTVLFPSDVTKGFYLTFREIMSRGAAFRNSLGLLANADVLLAFFEDQSIIKRLINVTDATVLDNFDEQGSLAAKIAGIPFYIPPPPGMVEHATVFNFLVKNGIRGIQWQSGTVLSPQDNLKFLGTIAKRMYYLLIPRPTYQPLIFESLCPGFHFERGSEENLFSQLRAWSLRAQSDMNWFRIQAKSSWINANESLENIEAALAAVLGIATDDNIVRDFHVAMNKANPDYIGVRQGETTDLDDSFSEIKNGAIQLRETRADPIQIIGSRFPNLRQILGTSGNKGRKNNRGRRAGTTERTVLGRETVAVLDVLRRRGFSSLAERMDAWFRGFLNLVVQEAVASLFAARLDAFLSAPLEVSRAERQAFMEPDSAFDDDNDGDNASSSASEQDENEDQESLNPDAE